MMFGVYMHEGPVIANGICNIFPFNVYYIGFAFISSSK